MPSKKKKKDKQNKFEIGFLKFNLANLLVGQYLEEQNGIERIEVN